MIYLKSISKSFGDRTLLRDVTATLSKKCTALVGMNGTGKSTLLKIIAGTEEPDDGTITKKNGLAIEYLSQTATYSFEGSVIEVLKKAAQNKHLDNLRIKEKEILELLDQRPDLVDELSTVQSDIESLELNLKKNCNVEEMLSNLGFRRETWEKPASTLSGGWQMRLALAQILIRRPDLVMLDEPTNYLDIETINFLIDWIRGFEGQVIVVSHDRWFLNSIVDETWEIFFGNLSIYKGNYDFYLSQREENEKLMIKKREKQIEEIDRLQKFIDKNRANANTATQAQSKIKQLKKLEDELIPLPRKSKSLTFSLPTPKRSGNRVVAIDNVGHSFGENQLFSNFTRIVTRGERLAFVGRNGIGKTTLMNICGKNLEPSNGTIEHGANIEISYFRQNEIEYLPKDMDVLEFVESITPTELFPKVKSILASFLFFEDSWDRKISVLSGGEKVRLAFIRIMLNPGNLLLLDEPTTHLDIDSREILLRNLKNLDATVVFVSHDHHFIDNLATGIVYFQPEKDPVSFDGSLSHYLSIYGEGEVITKTETTPKNEPEKAFDYSVQKSLRNKLNKLKKEIESIEQKSSELEIEKERIVDKINSGDGDIGELGTMLAAIEQKLETLIFEWEEKSLELESCID